MKKFILKTIYFILPLVIIFTCLEVLIRKIPNDYSYKNNYIHKNSSQIKMLILGSSHSLYSLNPEVFSNPDLRLHSFNLGSVSQSLEIDEALVKSIQKLDWKNLKYVVVPISYFSLYLKLSIGPEYWRIKNYNLYYGLNETLKIDNYFELLSVELLKNLDRIYQYYYLHQSPPKCSSTGWKSQYQNLNMSEFEESGKLAAIRHTGAGENHFYEIEKSIATIAKFAHTHGAKLIFFNPPGHHFYTDHFDLQQISFTLDYSKKLPSLYPNSFLLNLMYDQDFTKDDYFDADHLNYIGAKKFTLKFEKFLQGLN